MNEKIPLSLLAERFAKTQKCSCQEAENIIKTAFSLSAKSLIDSGSVNFPGLGSFVVENIDGGRAINFLPGANWEALVNSPFDMFTPQVIPENIDISLLENGTKETFVTELIENNSETATINQEELNEESKEDREEMPSPSALPEQYSPEPIDTTQDEQTVLQQSGLVTDKAEEDLRPISTYIGSPVPEEDETEQLIDETQDAATGGGFMKGFIIGLIVGLALGALGLCCYVLFYVNTVPSEESNHTQTEKIEESYIPTTAY